jgi:hypothetical protein
VNPLATHIARWTAEYGITSSLEIADVGPDRLRELEPADLVVVRGLPRAEDWRGNLRTLARLARKLLVVVTSNPDSPLVATSRLLGLGPQKTDVGHTEVLAPVLWEIGRVRDHVYLDAPGWTEGAPRLGRRLARLHAFAVDVRPRTRQARRRLAQARE